jgi:hypothetical protein
MTINPLYIQLTKLSRYSEEYIGIIAANIPCLKGLLEKAFHKLGGRVTNITSNSKISDHDLDRYPQRHLNCSSLTSPSKSYKPYPTRMEEDVVGYHTSLRETSRLEKLRRPESQEDILQQMKKATSDYRGAAFEFEEEKKKKPLFSELSINGRR